MEEVRFAKAVLEIARLPVDDVGMNGWLAVTYTLGM